MENAVIYETRDFVGIITLNRPDKANTISDALIDGVKTAIKSAEDDERVQVLIVTGAGKHFCGGADLKELSLARLQNLEGSARIGIEFDLVTKPVIAAINGTALGGGCEIALTCDFRYISKEAKIGLPEINFGALPAAGGTVRLPQLVGIANAKRLIMTGEPITAAEAFAMGLVDCVVEHHNLLEECMKLASKLAEKAPFALRAAKTLLQRNLEPDLEEALKNERRVIANMATPQEIKVARTIAASRSSTYSKIFQN